MSLPVPCIIRHHFDDGVHYCAVVKDGRDYVHVIRMDSVGMGVIKLDKERRVGDRTVLSKFEPLEGRNVGADLRRYLAAGDKFGITMSAERLLRECIDRADNQNEDITMARTKKQEVSVQANLENYKVSEKVRTPSGRKAVDSDDAIAKQLRGKTLDEVYSMASEVLGVTQKELHAKYDKFNPGMQRMNLGNRIRGARAKAKRTAPSRCIRQ